MRPHLLAAALAVIVPAAAMVAPHDAAADFDPSGRGKKPPKKPPGGGGAKPGGGGKKPGGDAATKPGDGDDGDAKKGPGTDTLIARYTAAAVAKPGDPFPIQRLAQLYRERDGNLKKLVEDFEKRSAGAGDEAWNAKVALAGIYKQDGRYPEAIKTYEAAIAAKPKEPAPLLALAALSNDKGEKKDAKGYYERAVALLKTGAELEQATRALLAVCLDLKDFDAAKKHHTALVKQAGNSLFVKAELGRELMSRGHYDKAEGEFRELVKAAAGDNRALAPALRDLGHSLVKQKKMDEGLTTLKKAMQIAGTAAGVRAEILLITADAFRADNKLPELIALLEKETNQDFQRLSMMGALYEETGNVTKAIATYRKALGMEAKNIDVRLKLVHLLQAAGELDNAIKEYELLIKAAPNNPTYVFELCETLIQRGDRPKALKLLTDLEARVKDPETLAAVADFYERVEEKDKALKLLVRVSTMGGIDPEYLVDLGDRYFQAGDKKKALETWARIKTLVTQKGRAAQILGDVYLDHDMIAEGLASMREAVAAEPNNIRYKKSLAQALERSAPSSGRGNTAPAYTEAKGIWEDILKTASAANDRLSAREARTRIVALWSLLGELSGKAPSLQAKFGATPPDLESGRLLAEVQRKLGKLAESEAVLKKIVAQAPGDEESFLALESVQQRQGNLRGAIETLSKLVEVNPKRAREFYQRMAQYAAELYKDDEAIQYAAKAVELSPEDASGHQKLGEMYRKRQDMPKAIGEFRQAIVKNDRLFPVYFDLAELLLSSGQSDEADQLFRRVVRACLDEELVARAARQSMQINLGKGSLDVLERDLLPVAVGNPSKPIYRRLLVELYGAMTFPLVQKVRRAPTQEASDKARAELAKIGARAIKPLLDALADDREAQQKIAIEVLAYVENKGAGPALYNYATGTADKALRTRAMIACGALRDPNLLEKFEKLLSPTDGSAVVPNDSIAVAAAWSVARLGDKKAEPLLVRLAQTSSPELRALGALGLGLSREKKHLPMLTDLARSQEAGSLARAAALHALVELSDASAATGKDTKDAGKGADLSLLLSVADASDVSLRQAALAALGRFSDAKSTSAAQAVASGVFAVDEGVRAAAVSASASWAKGKATKKTSLLPVPDGPLVVREILTKLARTDAPRADRAAGAVAIAPQLARAATAAVATSPERARVVADALLVDPGALSLAPFTSSTDKADADADKLLREAAEKVGAAVVPGFVALVRHPDAEVRTRAVELLARRGEPSAQAAVVDALSDPDDGVARAALSSVGPISSTPIADAVAKIVKSGTSWPLRVRAAEALGRLGATAAKASKTSALGTSAASALAQAARTDGYALVREAAARALAALDKSAATPVLKELEAKDAEPRVRKTAAELLKAK